MRTPDERLLTRRFAAQRPRSIEHAVRLLGPAACTRNRTEPVRIGNDAVEKIPDLLEGSVAVTVAQWLDDTDVSAIAASVDAWWNRVRDPAPLEVVGAAYFAHAGCSEDDYFRRAATAGAQVDAVAPGVVERLLGFCGRMVGEPVALRSGWAPPGIVMLDPVRLDGIAGDVHFDWEGLAAHPRAALDTSCYSFVSIVQAPESGAALRLWDISYGPADRAAARCDSGPDLAGHRVEYRPGDLLVFEATTLHRIEPISGTRHRAALTGHLAHMPEEGWQLWL